MRSIIMSALILGTLVLLAGCQGPEQAVEFAINQAARRYLGPADRYASDVRGLRASGADRVTLIGFGVRPAPDITLQRVALELTDIRFRIHPFLITNIGSARFDSEVTDRAVNAYLASQLSKRTDRIPLRSLEVAFQTNQVKVSAIASVAGIDLPLTTQGTLQPQIGQVTYLPQSISVGNAALSETLRGVVSRLANPLVDISSLNFGPRAESVALQPGQLNISGSADVNRLLQMQ